MPLIINGEIVEDPAIREEMRALRPHLAEAMAGADPIEIEMRVREWARENVIERVLLRQEALKDSTPLDPELVTAALRDLDREQRGENAGCVTPSNEEALSGEMEVRLRIERLVSRVTSQAPRPKPKQVLDFYKKHKDRFERPEVVRALHVVKHVDENTPEDAALAVVEQAARDIAGGADFGEVADRYSDCPGNGGDLGYFPRGEMVDQFDEIVFALEPGGVSTVFRTPFGYHVAKLVDRRPAGIRPFEEVREAIEAQLHQEKQQQALEHFLDQLRAPAEIREVRHRGPAKDEQSVPPSS